MPTALAAPMIRSGFSPANNCAIAASSEPTRALDGSRTSSMNSWNWLSGLTNSMSIFVQVKPGVSVGTMNSAGLSDFGLGSCAGLGAAHHEHRLRLVDTGDEHLLARQDPIAAVAPRGGGDAVGVGSGVGFGDGECHGGRAVGDAGQPALLLLLGAELADDRAVDCGGDDHHQQRRASGGHLLHYQRQLVHAGAAAAVLLGQVDPDEAEFACLVPQFVGVLAGARLLEVVVLPVVGGHGGDRLAQRLLFLGLDEAGHCESPCSVSTRASTAPTSTCWPGSTLSSASTPSAGAVTVCSIFIASSHTSGCPAVTVSPTAAPMRNTEPGMGARSEPSAMASSGSGKRGSATSCTGPRGESSKTSSP